MKKLMASLVCLGLLTGSMASAVMGPKEFWRCLTNEETCPESKRKEARAWIIGVPVAVIIATLAAVGIIVGRSQVEKMKEQHATRADITAEMTKLAEERRRVKATGDRNRLDAIDREMSRLNALRVTVGR